MLSSFLTLLLLLLSLMFQFRHDVAQGLFSLFVMPSLLHFCVICRKFHEHANSIEFGHTPPTVPATFPLTSWGGAQTHEEYSDDRYYRNCSVFPEPVTGQA